MALTTFKAFKDALADWLATSTTSPRWTDATRGIVTNRAIRYIARKFDLSYGEKTLSFNVLAGTRDYSMGTTAPDYSRPLYCEFFDPTTNAAKFVYFLTKDKFDALYPDPSQTADPSHFTVFAQELSFGKTPSRPLTMNLVYYFLPADLSADGDTNNWLFGAWDAVFDRALVEATEYLVEDERIDVWKAKWKDTESVLVMEQTRARSMGLIPQSIEPH